jgi:hypothetical protein
METKLICAANGELLLCSIKSAFVTYIMTEWQALSFCIVEQEGIWIGFHWFILLV